MTGRSREAWDLDTKMHITRLLERLEGNTAPPDASNYAGNAFIAVAKEPIGYVPPMLTVENWPAGAGALLIEAPGAVGKSAAAAKLAASLHWPLIQAQHAQVGSYSLSGLIHDALGFDANFLQLLAEGRSGVVIDSLDEAHFKAGTTNFLAFIENIKRVSERAGDALQRPPTLILMSRSDTAELIQLSFSEDQVPLALLRLAFFDRSSATRFISIHMDRRRDDTKRIEYGVPRGLPTPFQRLMDTRMQQMGAAISGKSSIDLATDWDQCAGFLGYAPVLVALAEALAVPNPAAEISALLSGEAKSAIELIAEIVDSILLREQHKFSSNIFDQIKANTPALHGQDLPTEFYTPTEQLSRIWSMLHDNPMVAPLPADLPPSVRDIYERAANQFISDHPFVRGRTFASPVFADYAKAQMALSVPTRASLRYDPAPQIDEVGAFFVEFLLQASQADAAQIDEGVVQFALESWNQESELRGSSQGVALLDLRASDGDLYLPLPQNEGPPRRLSINQPSGAMHFTRIPRDLLLITDEGVILGERNAILLFKGNVTIAAAEISIQSDGISVTRRPGGAGTYLLAQRIDANWLKSADAPEGCLSVFCDSPPAKLSPFVKQGLREQSQQRTMIKMADYVDLRAILTAFRSTVHLGLTVPSEHMNRLAQRGGNSRHRIINYLMSRGVVKESGAWYVLDTAALNRIGLSLNDLKSGTPTPGILTFLGECLAPPAGP